MVNKLLNITGIDRRISSSFSPRTNGAIEVFNKVFAETLRKCAETDTTNWHKFIPFVLLSYRTKVHESTKVTPYELVFGRKANHFEDWTCKPTNDENNEMLGRTLEIKKLFEETIPKARENLAKSAEVQKNNQNKRDTISNEKILPGTQVFIKAEGLLTKMANRYYGPYTVVREADGGNYVLKNALDEEMKLSFPRQKLVRITKLI